MTAVRCVDLCKTYRQGDEDIKALDHLSIDIDHPENGLMRKIGDGQAIGGAHLYP